MANLTTHLARAARAAFVTSLAIASSAGAQATPPSRALRQAMLLAEDSRDTSAAALAPLLRALAGRDTVLQALATRALGRFEQPTLSRHVVPMLASPVASVRFEAANALAQLAQGASGANREATVESLARPLRDALAREEHVRTRGLMAWSLGRMPYGTRSSAAAAESVLTSMIERPRGLHELVGAMRGMEALVRTTARLGAPTALTIAAIRRVGVVGRGFDHEPVAMDAADTPARAITSAPPLTVADPAEVRRLAQAVLIAAREGDALATKVGWSDPDPQVRRLTVLMASGDSAQPAARERIASGLIDRSSMVRLDALRAYGRFDAAGDCSPVLARLADSSAHVALLAIDLVGERCGATAGVADTLARLALALPKGETRSWHRAAHALVALSHIDSARAASIAPRFAAHPTAWVRMYAARAAEARRDGAELLALARDSVANVREAALNGLAHVRGHAADAAAIDALGARDYQLVLTAAGALAGTPDRARAVRALADALDRITRERRDTSRDPRIAILARLAELGDLSLAPRIRPYLADFDAMVADSAARLVSRWTGESVRAAPRPLAKPPLPLDEIERLRGARLRIVMASGDTIVAALFTDEAPATVLRLARLARAGKLDGRTFHRVVPNFVIQGGSPGANEYMGDSLYLRDEVYARPHARGTLGVSTRGRDTGDAQLFVNLVDNPRLDFGYTVFGAIERGMDAVDRVMEGDVMRRVTIVER
jgi:cyclophilin family peptidyl-prolyl cis-trans isomerase